MHSEITLQTGLAILVALANAAGPWLCCCVVAAEPRKPTPAKVARTVPACPHCCHEEQPPVNPEPQQPVKPAKPCPCEEQKFVAPAALPVPTVAVDATTADVAVGVSDLPPDPAARLVETVGDFTSDLPFLPTRVRLRAHHALRC
jgi:hypothetical protein